MTHDTIDTAVAVGLFILCLVLVVVLA